MPKLLSQLVYPADVPKYRRTTYNTNWCLLTKGTGRLLLLAGDQRMEHLNNDFWGSNIDPADNNPEHLFQIAAHAPIGALAVHYGLASRYGHSYRHLNYVIKLNGKTNLINDDPDSHLLATIDQTIELSKEAGFHLVGVGYSIYPGSRYEPRMLAEASQIIIEAHDNGLPVILWIYPRGGKVKNEDDVSLIAGAAGLAVSLGADFVKVRAPRPLTVKNIQRVVEAAGLTKVIFAGGAATAYDKLLRDISLEIKGGSAGVAIGRNIHQQSLKEASRRLQILSALIYEHKTLSQAAKSVNRGRPQHNSKKQ
ncbi:MAG TPA: aldolase [bacterium]|jgi:fructose-bisphosphate aldolase/6-deoxy-5-ketofructose 1-phosphate synthase|nr:aldolase [bacterium]HRS73226.1 aldolase [Patescibacteria group bacterium]HOR69468.1 aldolase [bacterium]HOS99165.1 aldolase [bacterium]HPD03329.1 aldolase [bacterium]